LLTFHTTVFLSPPPITATHHRQPRGKAVLSGDDPFCDDGNVSGAEGIDGGEVRRPIRVIIMFGNTFRKLNLPESLPSKRFEPYRATGTKYSM
jgi:hypothetical protein